MCCSGAVEFQWQGLARLVAMTLAFSLWYVVLPAKPLVDIAFLAFIPVVLLGKYFQDRLSRYWPARTSPGEISCVMSTTVRSALRDNSTAFISAT